MRYSEIQTFLQCPQKHNFEYVQGLKKELRDFDLEFGSAIHRCIACAFEGLDPVAVFQNEWEELEGLEFERRKYSYIQYFDMGMDFLQNFEARHLKHFSEIKSEVSFDVEYNSLSQKKYTFTGTMDFYGIYKNDFCVIDFKTSEKPYVKEKIQSNLQLYLYAYAVLKMTGKMPTKILYMVFVKNAAPRIQTLAEELTEEKLLMHLENACIIKDLSLSGLNFKNFNSCEYCAFTERCWK